MILSRNAIIEALGRGDLSIDPYNEDLLGAASIDLRLASYFRRFIQSDEAIALVPDIDYRDPKISEVVHITKNNYYELGAGETVLGITLEKVTLSQSLCGRLEGRSRFARLGLLIHISAGFMAPGTANQQVLEISNMSPRSLRLYPGAAICQCIFESMTGPAQHKGRYNKQTMADFIARPEHSAPPRSDEP